MGPKAIDRLLAAEPPREPLDNLGAVWRDFRWRRLKRGFRDPCIAYTADARNIRQAIRRAVDSRGEDGKLFFHQGRVWQWNRDEFCKNLLMIDDALLQAENFDFLWLYVDHVGKETNGIGPITIYDVTARLAAYRGLVADKVYIHGGVKDGLRSIGLDPNKPRGRVAFDRAELPEPLCDIKNLDWVEDFLCGYRVLIERMNDGS